MNKFLSSIIILSLLIGCASSPSNISRVSDGNYYTGSGGKEMRLGILVPQSDGLNPDQDYLPRMIQGTLVSNISKYSAISVLDRVSLDRVIAETLDPTYEDNWDIVRLGHVAQVGYMMTGKIMRTSTGYALQINVTDTTPNARTIASYSGTCSVSQLDDQTAIQKASEDLLTQMGVQLTDAARSELGRTSSSQNINAQVDLAKGIVAQQRGTLVEAMGYFQSATSYDPSLIEASKRLSAVSSNIRTGNIGADARNAIAARNAWIPILTQANEYYKNHLPIEVRYTPKLRQTGLSYGKGTVDLQFTVSSYASDNIKLMEDILSGLRRTGKKIEWGFESWPVGQVKTELGFALVNEYGRIISTQPVTLYNTIRFPKKRGGVVLTTVLIGTAIGLGTHIAINNEPTGSPTDTHNMGLMLAIGGGLIIGGCAIPTSIIFAGDNIHKVIIDNDSRIVTFRGVSADDITDKLTIKVTRVNGQDAEQATQSGYIRIIAGK
jgi:TolB-like protein